MALLFIWPESEDAATRSGNAPVNSLTRYELHHIHANANHVSMHGSEAGYLGGCKFPAAGQRGPQVAHDRTGSSQTGVWVGFLTGIDRASPASTTPRIPNLIGWLSPGVYAAEHSPYRCPKKAQSPARTSRSQDDPRSADQP